MEAAWLTSRVESGTIGGMGCRVATVIRRPYPSIGVAMKPPTLNVLLEDPVYRRMFKTIPHLSPTLTNGKPWSVWARRKDGKWRGGHFATYRDGWLIVCKALKSPLYEDVSIVSRRQMFEPPPGATWDYPFAWCSRCRRPSSFGIRPNHHALVGAPALITDTSEPRQRCYYCGIRQVAMPLYRG